MSATFEDVNAAALAALPALLERWLAQGRRISQARTTKGYHPYGCPPFVPARGPFG